jgi:hypothetical protein
MAPSDAQSSAVARRGLAAVDADLDPAADAMARGRVRDDFFTFDFI